MTGELRSEYGKVIRKHNKQDAQAQPYAVFPEIFIDRLQMLQRNEFDANLKLAAAPG